jgi:primosomal protein N' (replication factor Y)
MADYYFCSLGEALGAMVPSRQVTRGTSLVELLKPLGVVLHRVRSSAHRQIELVNVLKDGPVARVELLKLGKWVTGTLNILSARGIVKEHDPFSSFENPSDSDCRSETDPQLRLEKEMAELTAQINDSLFKELTSNQQEAFDQITSFQAGNTSIEPGESSASPAGESSAKTGVFLLHGITGSGKTEIYLHQIRRVLHSGGSAIMLVPEIALTVPMITVFTERFGSVLAVLHSRLTGVERYKEWMKIRSGEARVVLGARSAVFAPVKNLQLLILDEEGESSFKQQEVPRYHARTVAIKRASMSGAKVILGSATPSLETYYEATRGRYNYLRLAKRISGQPLPEISFVDMSLEFKEKRNKSVFSSMLKSALVTAFNDGGQALLFLNRRGHSTYVFCRSCSHVCKCPDCDTPYIYHFTTSRLRCHRCDNTISTPKICPSCKSNAIRFCGTGTQKIEEEFALNFPSIPFSRMDSDTTTKKDSHQKIFHEFSSEKTRCLIGTQMIARGFDFHNLQVAAIMNIDSTLNMPDFRAGERTFSLLVQVAGRVGRGDKPAVVVAQSYNPQMSVFKFAKRNDYEGFALDELSMREALNYPPFSQLIVILAENKNEKVALDDLMKICSALERDLASSMSNGSLFILGPSPALISKVKGIFRWQLLFKLKRDDEVLASALKGILGREFPSLKSKLKVNVDPAGPV